MLSSPKQDSYEKADEWGSSSESSSEAESEEELAPHGSSQHLEPGHRPKTEMDEELYPGSKLTKGESLLLIMGHSLSHHSSKAATESLLKLLEVHLPRESTLPASKYLFFKQLGSSNVSVSLFLLS